MFSVLSVCLSVCIRGKGFDQVSNDDHQVSVGGGGKSHVSSDDHQMAVVAGEGVGTQVPCPGRSGVGTVRSDASWISRGSPQLSLREVKLGFVQLLPVRSISSQVVVNYLLCMLPLAILVSMLSVAQYFKSK